MRFDFGRGSGHDLILAEFRQWCVVGGNELENLWPWRFRRRAWWSAMEHSVIWVEAERG